MLAPSILPILGVCEPQLGEQMEPDACVNVFENEEELERCEALLDANCVPAGDV